jgi:hypothetical protein
VPRVKNRVSHFRRCIFLEEWLLWDWDLENFETQTGRVFRVFQVKVAKMLSKLGEILVIVVRSLFSLLLLFFFPNYIMGVAKMRGLNQ